MKLDDVRGGLLRYLGLLAVPGIPCFCWYALGGAGDAGSGFRALALIAYPLALLGVGGIAMALLARRNNGAARVREVREARRSDPG